MTEFNPAEINQDALRAAAPLVVRYKNWRGETSTRRILPLAVPRHGTNEWHKEPQWLLLALDVDKGEEREFAMRDVAAIPYAEDVSAENEALRDLVQALIDNEPDEPIADGGHVVLDLWRHQAKAILSRAARDWHSKHGGGADA